MTLREQRGLKKEEQQTSCLSKDRPKHLGTFHKEGGRQLTKKSEPRINDLMPAEESNKPLEYAFFFTGQNSRTYKRATHLCKGIILGGERSHFSKCGGLLPGQFG